MVKIDSLSGILGIHTNSLNANQQFWKRTKNLWHFHKKLQWGLKARKSGALWIHQCFDNLQIDLIERLI